MADEGEYLPEPHAGPGGSAAKWILLLLGVLTSQARLYFLFNLRERIDQLDKGQNCRAARSSPTSPNVSRPPMPTPRPSPSNWA